MSSSSPRRPASSTPSASTPGNRSSKAARFSAARSGVSRSTFSGSSIIQAPFARCDGRQWPRSHARHSASAQYRALACAHDITGDRRSRRSRARLRTPSRTAAATSRSSRRPARVRPRSSRSGSLAARRRRAGRVDRRLHVHREGRRRAQGAHPAAGHAQASATRRPTSSAAVRRARSTAYCFRLLQTHVPAYETYTPLDENQLVNLALPGGEPARAQAASTRTGSCSRDRSVPARASTSSRTSCSTRPTLPEATSATRSRRTTRCSTATGSCRSAPRSSGRCEALEEPDVHAQGHGRLRHLIVDEYQDVNPAQERLIELLAKPHGQADLVVVGDDDQAIYQWRGSNVDNIVTFAERYDDVHARSDLSSTGARGRRSSRWRTPSPRRSRGGSRSRWDPYRRGRRAGRVVRRRLRGRGRPKPTRSPWTSRRSTRQGVPYRDIAVLVRGKVAYPRILDAFEAFGIPVQPGGRTGLFEQPEAAVFGATFAWLADIDWAPGRFIQRETIDLDDLLDDYADVFELADGDGRRAPRRTSMRGRRSTADDRTSTSASSASSTRCSSCSDVATWDTTDDSTAQPARHPRPLHQRPRRLRDRHPPLAARPRQPGRAGRRRRSAASGSTRTSRSSSSTTPTAATTTSTARRTCSPTASPSAPSTAPRAWSGRSSSSRR